MEEVEKDIVYITGSSNDYLNPLNLVKDIKEIDRHMRKNEELYDVLYDELTNTLDKKYILTSKGVSRSSSIKEISELGGALSQIRSNQIKASQIKSNIRLSVGKIILDQQKMRKDDENFSEIDGRNILKSLFENKIETIDNRIEDQKEIEKIIKEKKIRDNYSNNDNAMISDFKGISYQVYNNEIVAVDDENRILTKYPKERLMHLGKLTKKENDCWSTSTGMKLKERK